MSNTKRLLASLLVPLLALSSAIPSADALTVASAVNSIQGPLDPGLPNVANPRGNVGYILANIFYGSSDGAKNGMIRPQYLDLSGIAASQWTTSGSTMYYTGTSLGLGTSSPNTSYRLDVNGGVRISNGLLVSAGTVDLPNGSLMFSDLNQNGCAVNQIPKWSGTAWTCGNDVGITGYTETDPLWTSQSGSYVKKTDYASATTTGVLIPADWNTFNNKLSSSGATINRIPKFSVGNVLLNSLIYDDGTKIGIGTTSPTQMLDIAGNEIIEGSGSLYFRNTNNYISSPAANQLAFGTNGGLDLMIDTTGYVGIGISNPGEMLEVNGNIKLSGASPSYRVTNIASPIGDYDAANKIYVDTKVSAAGTTSVSSQFLPDGSYYSEGGSPYFCRLNVLEGTSQRIISVNQNKLCNSSSNLYCNAGNCNADASILTNIKQNYQLIAAKDNQSCSISDGQVYCWGYSGNGQKYMDFSVAQASGQNGFACALVGNGQIHCWGHGSYGQLGDGNGIDRAQPVTVSGINNAVKVVTAGAGYSTYYARACALLSTGQIKCWGYLPSYGQTNTPVLISGVSNAVDIAMSADNGATLGHWCAALSSGSVVCGGTGDYGQLGNGAAGNVNWTTPVTVSGISNAVKVYVASAGYSTDYGMSCAVLSDGSIKCWGYNNYGRLGNGNTTQQTTPVAQVGMGTSSGMSLSSQNTSPEGHSCEVEANGTVKCWGQGNYGQLGNGGTSPSSVPVNVTWISNAVKIYTSTSEYSTSYGRSCALLSDASVKCWWFFPVNGTSNATPVSILSNIVDFSMTQGNGDPTTNGHYCAVTSTGTVLCWGYNGYGQLGNGTTTSANWTAPVTVSGITNAVKIFTAGSGYSTNYGRSCAILSDGTVKCWGYFPTNATANSTPVAISGVAGAVDMSLSDDYGSQGHYCVVQSNGQIKCGGTGNYGQLGNGTTTSANWTAPVTVSGISNATRVFTASSGYVTSANYGRSCAILSDGTVKCWGYLASYGQANAPVTISGVTNAVDLAMSQVGGDSGNGHFCVAQSNGKVVCGGTGDYGQLGNGASSNVNWTTPVQVSNISNAIKVFASSTAYSTDFGLSCALLSDWLISCWGSAGSYGRLGDGQTSSTGKNLPSYVASPVANAIDVSVSQSNQNGESHACAVQSNGTVKCWGQGNYGQLGNGNTTNSPAPVQVYGISNAVRVFTASTSYTTAYGRSCAILADGTVKCWGFLPGYGTAYYPVAISGISNAVDMSMSPDNSNGSGTSGHYCIVLATGTIMCGWANDYGQLGNGTSTTTNWVTGAVAVSGITNAVDVNAMGSGYSTNYGYSCATLADGQIKCWGYGASVRLGDSAATSSSNVPVIVANTNSMYYAGVGAVTVDKTIPTVKDGITAATSVAAGSYHSCAIEGGTVKCWGYNAEGQLGNNSTNNSTVPVGVFGISTASQIAAGYMHTCAVLTDGTVKCWGLNAEGQLGNGGTTSSTTPVQVNGITNAVQISAGDYHTCAVLATGSVQCWGLNTKGQLGTGGVGSAYSAIPVTVTGVSGATRIASGDAHNCAIGTGSGVYCWGDGSWGQLGSGTYAKYAATPIQVSGISNATRIGAGSNHTCVVLSDTTMKCWWLNATSQQASTGYYATATPTALLGVSNLLTVVGGAMHSCTISTDLGSLNCFGGNRNGQLGNGNMNTTSNLSIVSYPVDNSSGVTNYTLALCETRDVFNGNLGGLDGANAICQTQCGTGYKMARESEIANFKNSAVTSNVYWIDRSQANNCTNWTDSSSGINGATVQFLTYSGTYGVMNSVTSSTAACNLTKQIMCVRGIR